MVERERRRVAAEPWPTGARRRRSASRRALSVAQPRLARPRRRRPSWSPTSGSWRRLRAVKDAEELDAVRRSAAPGRAGVRGARRRGPRGPDASATSPGGCASFPRARRRRRSAFDTIVASARARRDAARRAARRRDRRGTLVTIDLGCSSTGYCSDCTRTFATRPDAEPSWRIYEICLRAQEAALDAVRPGPRVPRGGRGRARHHRRGRATASTSGTELGHGVGLAVHEGRACGRLSAQPSSRHGRHSRAGHVPARAGRRADRGSRDRDRRRPRAAHAYPKELISRRGIGHGRDDLHEPVQERHAHRARRHRLADRRVPARQAGQGRRVRAHQAEGAQIRRGRRQDVPGRREDAARPHRGERT